MTIVYISHLPVVNNCTFIYTNRTERIVSIGTDTMTTMLYSNKKLINLISAHGLIHSSPTTLRINKHITEIDQDCCRRKRTDIFKIANTDRMYNWEEITNIL